MEHRHADSNTFTRVAELDPLVAIYEEMGTSFRQIFKPAEELPPKVIRQWRPSAEISNRGAKTEIPTALNDSPIAFVSRHPAFFASDFADLPEMIIGRSPRSVQRGRQHRHHSVKMGRTLRSCSDLEFEAQRLLEVMPFANYVEQAVIMRYRDKTGKKRWHRPDLAIWGGQSTNFTEVKYEKDARKLEDKWEAIGTALGEIGFGYEVITECRLREASTKQTIDRVFRSRSHIPAPSLVVAAMQNVSPHTSLSISDLTSAVAGLTFDNVLCLVQYGVLNLDPKAPLDMSTTVGLGPFPLISCERRRGHWRMKIRGVNFDRNIVEIDGDQPETFADVIPNLPRHAKVIRSMIESC